ncbi:602_t:CDS:2, partial [Acaulospora morrowiae]
DPEEILQSLERGNFKCADWLDKGKYRPSYNVAPNSYQPVIRIEQGSKQTVIHTMRWGLVPFWSKSVSNTMKTANCRDDSLTGGKPMFNSMKNSKRCIVIAQGFFEWLHKGKQKIPHFVKRKDGELLFFAGLYDSVRIEGQEDPLYTYTIITTTPSNFISLLHNRMPVIFERGSDAVARWLNPDMKWNPELASLLKPYEGELTCYRVPQEVGKVGNDSPSFIVPISTNDPSISTRETEKIKKEDKGNTLISKFLQANIKEEQDEEKSMSEFLRYNVKDEQDDKKLVKSEIDSMIPMKRSREDTDNECKPSLQKLEDLVKEEKLSSDETIPKKKMRQEKELRSSPKKSSKPKRESSVVTKAKPRPKSKSLRSPTKKESTSDTPAKSTTQAKKKKGKDKAVGSAKITSFFGKSEK